MVRIRKGFGGKEGGWLVFQNKLGFVFCFFLKTQLIKIWLITVICIVATNTSQMLNVNLPVKRDQCGHPVALEGGNVFFWGLPLVWMYKPEKAFFFFFLIAAAAAAVSIFSKK